jgi:predicted aminopeptidase
MRYGAAILPPLCSALFLFMCGTLFSACYTLKQGAALLGYLSRAVPLETLSRAGGDDARFAALVADIRLFAMQDLGLKNTKNYTRYVAIDRDYLAAVVSACAPDSFTAYQWHFPVVGTMPYKGFFDPADARALAASLEKKGLDVWVRGVDAFSTLGYFRDPLYSYMQNYSAYELADVLIHELFHATVFIKNQMQFNEELAEFTGRTGAKLYIESRYGKDAPQIAEAALRREDGAVYVAFLQKLKEQLAGIYAQDLPRAEKLARKAAAIRAAQTQFTAVYDSMFQTDSYRFFASLEVNNAYLQLYSLYHESGGYLEDLYQTTGSDLPAFIAAAKKIKPTRPDPKKQLEAALGL